MSLVRPLRNSPSYSTQQKTSRKCACLLKCNHNTKWLNTFSSGGSLWPNTHGTNGIRPAVCHLCTTSREFTVRSLNHRYLHSGHLCTTSAAAPASVQLLHSSVRTGQDGMLHQHSDLSGRYESAQRKARGDERSHRHRWSSKLYILITPDKHTIANSRNYVELLRSSLYRFNDILSVPI